VQSTTLPWGKPRREWLVLALVAAAALSPVYALNAQDNSRLCLTQALVHGRLSNDGCFALDHARYHGHEYTDKAPGLSLVELPLALALRLPPVDTLHRIDWRLWLFRILSSGLIFLACALLVGRVSEGLAPGFGSISLVTFALGTLIAAFAPMNFDQVPAALLGLAAFLLAWRGRPLSAGLLAGTAVLFEYQMTAILVIVALYVVARTRAAPPLARYVAGVVPGLAILAAYDWLAFGAPWRLSYRYVDNLYESQQTSGLFGIGLPRLYATHQVFAGRGGLLVASPVLLASAWGLVMLAKRYRAEAAVCGSATAVFVVINCGYFLPYGGSPGPRFLIPALPFLALGLGPAFAWRPRLTSALALFSVVTTTALLLVWGDDTPFRGGVLGEAAHVPVQLGSSHFVQQLEFTLFDWVAPGRAGGAAAVMALALAAFVVAFRTIPHEALRTQREPQGARSAWVTALGIAACGLLVAAQASAMSGYPYAGPRQDLSVSVQATSTAASPGQEFDFAVWASNSSAYQGYGTVVLTVELPAGSVLLGSPAYERGSGCSGTTTLTCNLDSLSPKMSTPVRIGVRITRIGPQTVTASLSADGVAQSPRASLTLDSG
jgi:hypothetical protein